MAYYIASWILKCDHADAYILKAFVKEGIPETYEEVFNRIKQLDGGNLVYPLCRS